MTCSECGTRAKERLTLAERVFVCTACGYVAGRDANAARVILAQGERILAGADDIRQLPCLPSGVAGGMRSELEIPRLKPWGSVKRRLLPLILIGPLLAACGSSSHQSATGSVHPEGWGAPPTERTYTLTAPQSTAVMFDTTTLGALPGKPFALAGYTAGRWPTYPKLRHGWPTAHSVSIAIGWGYRADCLDVEPGDATPAEVPGWINAERRLEAKPCIYSDWYEWTTQIRPILVRAHIAGTAILKWVADYAGCPALIAGFDADQCTDHAYGRNLDESVVDRSFLSIAQPPLVAPRPAPKPKPKPAPRPKPKPPVHRKTCNRQCQRHRELEVLIRRHYCTHKRPVPNTGRERHACGVWRRQAR